MVLGNLVDLARLLLINEECGDLQIAVDDRELTRNNIRKKKSEVFQAYNRCQICDK